MSAASSGSSVGQRRVVEVELKCFVCLLDRPDLLTPLLVSLRSDVLTSHSGQIVSTPLINESDLLLLW